MLAKRLATLALAGALVTVPVTRAAADLHGFVGGFIAGTIINQNSRVKRQPSRTYTGTRVTSAQRTANREMQTALNYFGFPAGTPDGVVGRRTRAAVSSYQTFMGFPATGTLGQLERDILMAAYQRGIAGSAETVQLVSRDPMGAKALLNAQKEIMFGQPARRTTGYAGMPIEVSDAIDEIAASSDPSAEQLLQRSGFIQLADLNGDGKTDYILDTSYSGSSFWCNPTQCKALVFASTPSGYARNDLLAFSPTPASFDCIGSSCQVVDATVMASVDPGNNVGASAGAAPPTMAPEQDDTTTMASTSGGGLGTLPVFEAPTVKPSLASDCNKVTLLTNANGGFTTVDTMTDVAFAMREQHCLARTFAIDLGEQRAASLQGVTPAQISAQCAAYGPALQPYVASVGLKARQEAIRDFGTFVLNSGIDAAQLKLTAEICLAEGYRIDDMDIAIGAAMLMVVLGEGAYAELVGHHLNHGFGVSQRPDLAVDWYQSALDAVADGATPVFAPSFDGRQALLQQAVFELQGGGSRAESGSKKGSLPQALPTFSVSE